MPRLPEPDWVSGTSNLHPTRFDTIFPKGLATAAVDRLLHHAHVVVTEGCSHRLAEALDGARGPAACHGRGRLRLTSTVGSTTPVGVVDEEENDGVSSSPGRQRPVPPSASVQIS